MIFQRYISPSTYPICRMFLCVQELVRGWQRPRESGERLWEVGEEGRSEAGRGVRTSRAGGQSEGGTEVNKWKKADGLSA